MSYLLRNRFIFKWQYIAIDIFWHKHNPLIALPKWCSSIYTIILFSENKFNSTITITLCNLYKTFEAVISQMLQRINSLSEPIRANKGRSLTPNFLCIEERVLFTGWIVLHFQSSWLWSHVTKERIRWEYIFNSLRLYLQHWVSISYVYIKYVETRIYINYFQEYSPDSPITCNNSIWCVLKNDVSSKNDSLERLWMMKVYVSILHTQLIV